MKYIFSLPEPFTRFVKVEMIIEKVDESNDLIIQLPAWRPGRYELVNFAKNIRFFQVKDDSGNNLKFKKQSKDRWCIYTNKSSVVHVHYEYYAAQPDAGACFIDHEQLYVNPVHCCFYIPGREKEECVVQLNVPDNWKLACGMKKTASHTMKAADFDQLADSPFIASPSLKHAGYEMNEIEFNIWLQGECNPDWDKIIEDFKGFTRVQLDMMKDFPANDYHFLVQLLPTKFYHGVEHVNSTVLAMGPGINLMNKDFYDDFLGVASHELFHCWNVKTIRPTEMMPYKFNDENYAETGYVYEGVTTYYGDLFLGRSGYFNLNELLAQYSKRLQKHMDNPGRFNYSVAESSFDTWLDGYVPGVPGRKVSIYDEGCLLAWVLDFMIRSSTESKNSLDDVIKTLNTEFAMKGRGYSQEDYISVAEKIGGRDFKTFFNDYVFAAGSLESLLSEVLSLAGISIEITANDNPVQRLLGARVDKLNGSWVVNSVYPGSPFAEGSIVKDDELVAINGIQCDDNLESLVMYALQNSKEFNLLVCTGKKLRAVNIVTNSKNYFSKYRLISEKQLTHSQLEFKNSWLSVV